MNHHHSSSAADVITLLLFVLVTIIPNVTAQPSPTNDDPYNYQRFSPSMAIIIVVLIGALFVMGFFSIYIRHCSQPESSGTVRGANGSTGRSRSGAAARGLDAAIIGTFPTLEYKVVKGLKIGKGALECAVCLNEFEDDETLRLIPKCDHVFHPECIDEWLASHTTCPVCRANLSPQDVDAAAVVDVAELTTSNTTTTRDHQTDVESGQHDQHDREECNDDSSARSVHNNATTEPDVLNVNEILNQNRTRGSSRSFRFMRLFPRSHSTGHSILVQPGENTKRFTLRLPVEVRKQIMNRELHRSTSVVELPRGGSSRRGPRMGDSGGNNRVRSFRVFSRAPSFLTRMLSMTSPKVASNEGEGTSAEPTKSGSVHLPV